jgi:hypothetical protein
MYIHSPHNSHNTPLTRTAHTHTGTLHIYTHHTHIIIPLLNIHAQTIFHLYTHHTHTLHIHSPCTHTIKFHLYTPKPRHPHTHTHNVIPLVHTHILNAPQTNTDTTPTKLPHHCIRTHTVHLPQTQKL